MSLADQLHSDCPDRIKTQLIELAVRHSRKVLAWTDELSPPPPPVGVGPEVSVAASKADCPRRFQRVVVRHEMEVTTDELLHVLLPNGVLAFSDHLCPIDDVRDVREVCRWFAGSDAVIGVSLRVKAAPWKASAIRQGTYSFLQHSTTVWDRAGSPSYVTSWTRVQDYYASDTGRVTLDAIAPTCVGFVFSSGADSRSMVVQVVGLVADKHAAAFTSLGTAFLAKILARIRSLRFASFSSNVASLLPGAIARDPQATTSRTRGNFLGRFLRRDTSMPLDSAASLLLSPTSASVSSGMTCYLCPGKAKPHRQCTVCKQLLCKKCREKVHGQRVCRPCIYKGEGGTTIDPLDVRSSEVSSSGSSGASSSSLGSSGRGVGPVLRDTEVLDGRDSEPFAPQHVSFRDSLAGTDRSSSWTSYSSRDTEVTRAENRLCHLEGDFNAVCAAMCTEFDCKFAVVVIGNIVGGVHCPRGLTLPPALMKVPTFKFADTNGYHLHYIKELPYVVQKNLHDGPRRVGHVLLADDKMHRRGNPEQTAADLQAYEDTLVEINQSTIL
ncbi:hypothetical protein ACHHYP_01780 [Achlya hypogyna]|uniref:Uncharacterized protein n=1 Tax=Achlya hypogyna TaxID=1202772 RepID=A0A1V9ZT48_ACHHY|nr:hypothetical protein ACHHYP_01780 [Achlya hypogyna]